MTQPPFNLFTDFHKRMDELKIPVPSLSQCDVYLMFEHQCVLVVIDVENNHRWSCVRPKEDLLVDVMNTKPKRVPKI